MGPTRPRIRSNNGCMACRRRKKKCDETKPTCGACQRLELRCFWTSTEERQSANTSIVNLDPALSLPFKRSRDQPILHKYLSLAPFKDQICAAFVLETYFKESNAPLDSTDAAKNGFTVQTTLAFDPADDSLAWECVFAHGLLVVGHRNQDRRLIEEGTLRNCKVMRNICHAIGDERRRHNLDTLAAINNLGMMSIMRLCVKINGIPVENFDHVGGLIAVLGTMSPKQFQEPKALAFFEYIRYGSILVSLLTGQQTCFALDPWKTIPWAQSKHGKSSLHKVVDLICDVVPLQSKLHLIIPHQGPVYHTSRECLDQHIGRILSKLHDWRQALGAELELDAAILCDTAVIPLCLRKSNRLYEIGIFNMLLIYLCRFLVIDASLLDSANTFACSEVKGQVTAPRSDLPIIPLLLPVEDPLERAASAAKEISLIWQCYVRNGISSNSAIFLAIPLRVAQMFLAEFDYAADTHLDQAEKQIADFWTGRWFNTEC